MFSCSFILTLLSGFPQIFINHLEFVTVWRKYSKCLSHFINLWLKVNFQYSTKAHKHSSSIVFEYESDLHSNDLHYVISSSENKA